jgi:GT2 family glycosyltransferase
MNISIIIPTYNRNETLCRTLQNILQFEDQYYELIVVDQTENHNNITTMFLNELTEKKKIVYILLNHPNLPNARNEGIKAAKGDIILFFDDDIAITDSSIQAHVMGHLESKIGCVTGQVVVHNENPDKNMVFIRQTSLKNIIKNIFFIFHRAKASYAGKFGVLSDFTLQKKLPADTGIGCNMSFKKELFAICGNFDINYTENAVREDTDMCLRIKKEGYKTIYIPEASLIHYMDNSGGTRVQRNEEYWYSFFKNQCYFYKKNFYSSKLLIFLVLFFEIIRCKRSGLKAVSVFDHSYKNAVKLAGAIR